MRTVAILPARMGSTRFPGKPLAMMLGKPMIQHVYERVAKAKGLAEVLVATCDREIADACASFGARAIMRSEERRVGKECRL